MVLLWWRRGELNLFMLLKTRKLLISVLYLFHRRHRFRPRLLNFAHSFRPRDSRRLSFLEIGGAEFWNFGRRMDLSRSAAAVGHPVGGGGEPAVRAHTWSRQPKRVIAPPL